MKTLTKKIIKKTSLLKNFSDIANSSIFHQNGFVKIDNEDFYCIANVDRLEPFLMNIITDSDLWLFVASNGGITAGRINPDYAIFPYITVDKLYDSIYHTGPFSIIRGSSLNSFLWEPFHDRNYKQRNLYKNIVGNKIIFEEFYSKPSLRFRYSWTTSSEYGIIRTVSVKNMEKYSVSLEILDGVKNILPAGVGYNFQNTFSNLADAYKWTELIDKTSLAVYILNAGLTDKPEPEESLYATTCFSCGIEEPLIFLEEQEALKSFFQKDKIYPDSVVTGCRGSYFLKIQKKLNPEEEVSWIMALDTKKTQSEVNRLKELISNCSDTLKIINKSINNSTQTILSSISEVDGLQLTGRKETTVRHFMSTVFNCMRGGRIAEQGSIIKIDFINFIYERNRFCAKRISDILKGLPQILTRVELLETAKRSKDIDFLRLSYEYMPLVFSRRHGDPSRPWNFFEIKIRDSDGNFIRNYEGNWRDIFQNWEALFLSFPEWYENAIIKFLNAMSLDGYNPLQINRKGINWERIDPQDPWNNFGYWSDHQVVYLHRLMIWLEKFYPGKINDLLNQEIFSSADIPYRIKSYSDILKNPKKTIVFDVGYDREISRRELEMGTDAKLVPGIKTGEIRYINMIEKLLIIILVKLSNFVPAGGIWLNTQRPEWNDANNALAGYGLSMVTLCYLRSFISFLNKILTSDTSFDLSESVAEFLFSLKKIMEERIPFIKKVHTDPEERKQFLDEVELAGEHYRNNVYARQFGNKKSVASNIIKDFFNVSLQWLDETIKVNKRDDSLYHSYNLIHFHNGKVEVERMFLMLEGQVAVLNSGILSSKETVELFVSLRNSPLYSKEHNSYILYPVKTFPRWLERNIIPEEEVKRSALFNYLISIKDMSLVVQDDKIYRFSPEAINSDHLDLILDRLENDERFTNLVKRERTLIHEIYEKVFKHHSFTGRSGVMFAYEGIGSVYWHMVSKLILATQENIFFAKNKKPLIKNYFDIRNGLGFNKTPYEYGAFPFDPYSHSPSKKKARQPGMTGQVKEDIICRLGEVGIFIDNGSITVDPFLVEEKEFLTEPEEFKFKSLDGSMKSVLLKKDQFAFTFCQVLFVVEKWQKNNISINVELEHNKSIVFNDSRIDPLTSSLIFNRTGKVKRVNIFIPSEIIVKL